MPDEKKDDKGTGNLALDAAKAILSSPVAEEMRPTAHQLNRLAERILGAGNSLLFPLYVLKRVGEMWEKRFEKRMENLGETVTPMVNAIPLEHRQIAPAKVVMDVLEGIVLTEDDDDELRQMYARLLASAMDSRQEKVHPSFAKIVGEMTSKEATIFKQIVGSKPPIPLDYLTDDPLATSNSTPLYSTEEEISIVAYVESLARHQIIEIKEVYNGNAHFPRFIPMVYLTRYGVKFYEAVTGDSGPRLMEIQRAQIYGVVEERLHPPVGDPHAIIHY